MARKKLAIGSTVAFKVNNLSFDVKIIETKKRVQQEYLIEPVSGTGKDWVASFDRSTKPLKKK